MSWISLQKILAKISICATWFLYLAIVYVFTELSAGFALKVYRDIQIGATDYDTHMEPEVKQELALVQSNIELNLYRWYSNLPNYKGDHVTTDSSGFRINPDTLTGDQFVGMFGGSTTFSVLTDQDGTIPNLLSGMLPEQQVLNFGVGGYSTGAEIMTFVEALRSYPQMKTAVFYDGVNEIGPAFERIGSENLIKSYQLIGAPYIEGERAAISSKSPGISINDSNLYYIFQRIRQIVNKNSDIKDTEQVLQKIVNRYFENLKVINGICSEYNIKCLFTWQPSVFTLAESSLSERERTLKKEAPFSDYVRLTELVLKDERSPNYKIINLSEALDQKPSTEQFYVDWCHLNEQGNTLVARALANLLDINE